VITVRPELLEAYSRRREAIVGRLSDFAAVPPSEYFYELVYCLLTPQSSAVNAGRVVEALKLRDFFRAPFDPEPLLGDRNHYIRFHKTKAARLLRVRNDFSVIRSELSNGHTSAELRAWLVVNVNGFGLKEASHFLRNIGHRDLAILDRHVLRHLVANGVIQKVPPSLTGGTYLGIEKKFRAFSTAAGIPMDELDLLFWSSETGVILK